MFALLALLCGVMLSACGSNYSYESVKGDPTGARIYTLDNGLKVYMAPNSEEPRIQTYIAVKVGGKTGTAQRGADKNDNRLFVCTAPYDDTEIVISVVIEPDDDIPKDNAHGSSYACVAAARVLEEYYGK